MDVVSVIGIAQRLVRCVAGALLLLVAPSAITAAQEKPALHAGELTRLYPHGELPVDGEFLGASADTVWLRLQCGECRRRAMVRSSIDSAAVRGTGSRLRQSLQASLIGAYGTSVAFLGGIWLTNTECRDGIPCALVVVLAPVGALVGGVIGWLTTPRVWVLAELPISTPASP